MSEDWRHKRRSVNEIAEYVEPKDMFYLIGSKNWGYDTEERVRRIIRDRAMMSFVYCTAGRISSVVGGERCRVEDVKKADGNIERKAVKIGMYDGLRWENLVIEKGRIIIEKMQVVKRSRKVIEKYGAGAAIRDPLVIPLKRGQFANQYWDQLVPFGLLILEFVSGFGKREGAIFNYGRKRAYQIIRHATGKFPNWFRAQAEHFYGHYLISDTVKLAQFVKVVRPATIGRYIGHDWKQYLKDYRGLDFEWIDKESIAITRRIIASRQIARE